MAEIVFNELVPPQIGEFTFSALDPQELILISDIANWNDPQRYVGSIFQTHGRSIVFRSPSREINDPSEMMLGRYGGLQLIGAGGDPSAIREGFFDPRGALRINPVDPIDHSIELKSILQQRAIDKRGQLQMWRRSYAPLHGMDQLEADSRRIMSERVRGYIQPYHDQGQVTIINGPELAAEGVFPEKLDPQGEPLHFQVYRVPLVERFQTQMVHSTLEGGFEVGGLKLHDCSFLMGTLLNNFHELDLAYMNGYIGNLGLIEAGEKRALYITDLGSIRDFKEETQPIKIKYRAFDIFMYLESVHRFLSYFSDYFGKEGGLDPGQQKMLVADLKSVAAKGLLRGYFASEFKDMKNRGDSIETIRSRIAWRVQKLLDRHAQYSSTPQKFLDFFDGFYRSLRS